MSIHLRCLLVVLAIVTSSHLALAETVTWTNAAGGNWNVPGNWNPNQVPGASDTAVFTNAGTYTVTLNVDATIAGFVLGGGSGSQTFTNASQMFTLDGPGTVAANALFRMGGGTLNGTGTLTLNGAFTWGDGTMSGTGVTTIDTNGSLTIGGSALKSLNTRTLINLGTTTWNAGQFNLNDGGTISNAAGATFDIAHNAVAASFNTGSFANAGLLRKTAGTGTAGINAGIAFYNSGTVEVQSGTLSLHGGGTSTGAFIASAGATLDLGGGTHAFAASATVSGPGNFSVSAGTADLNGSLTAGGTYTFSGGTANFGGSYAITNTLVVSGGTANLNANGLITPVLLNLTGGTLAGTNVVTVSGPTTWSGTGTISGSNTVTAAGGLIISSIQTKTIDGRTLINTSNATWNAGQINLNLGGTISNAAGATFDIAHNAVAASFNTGRFANGGLLRKTAGAGTAGINAGIPFNNSGTVEVQSGTLSLHGGGTSTGAFIASAGATLDLGGGTHAFAASATVSGPGNFSVSAGTANLNGSLNAGGTNTFSGGTANFGGSYAITNALVVSGGTANFNANGLITPVRVDLTGGTLAGTNVVTVSGPMTWSGDGAFSGSSTVTAGGGLTISGAPTKTIDGRTLINASNAMWSAGQINLNDGGTISNPAGATFDIAHNAVAASFNTGSFANAGLLRKTAGAGTAGINAGVPFNNSGTVEVQSGTLSLHGGGTSTGAFIASAGATLDLGGGTHAFDASATVSGPGNFSVSAGTANLNGTLTVGGTNTFSGGTANFGGSYAITNALVISGGTANFNASGLITPVWLDLTGGTLGGTNVVTVGGPLTWSGIGTFSGSNAVTAGGGLIISSIQTKTINGRTLLNTSNATWNAGQVNLNLGGTISNAAGATFDIAHDALAASFNTGSFANAGLLRKTVGAGTAGINAGIAFNNSGTVEVQSGTLAANGIFTQTAGLTLLNGGNLAVASPFLLKGGTLAGNGIITGSVTSDGTVSPGASPGQLIIGGNYVQTTNGTYHLELGGTTPVTTFDRLVVSNQATLAGALNISLTNGFVPAIGNVFEIMTYGSHSGHFAPVTGRRMGGTLLLVEHYQAAGLILAAEDAPHPAIDSAMIAANGLFSFHAPGILGETYVVEASTNLALGIWVPIATNTLPGFDLDFTDPDTQNFLSRFYRVYLTLP